VSNPHKSPDTLQTSSSSGCDKKKVIRQCAAGLEIRIPDVILATCDWFNRHCYQIRNLLFSIRKILGLSKTKCTTPPKIDWNMLVILHKNKLYSHTTQISYNVFTVHKIKICKFITSNVQGQIRNQEYRVPDNPDNLFCRLVPKICVPSAWDHFHVALLTLRTLK
jgi:hypothetical protein